MEPQ